MFNENLKKLRKQKGMSQEVLAQQMNVVRQTISKWEKGYSVPDAEMLIRLADLFEVSVSDLLGSEVKSESNQNEIAVQLAILNEQLANRKRWNKNILRGFVITILILLVAYGLTKLTKISVITIDAKPPLSKETISYTVVTYGEDQDLWYGGEEYVTEKVVEPYIERYGKHYAGSLFPVIYQFLDESHYTIDCNINGYLSGYSPDTIVAKWILELD